MKTEKFEELTDSELRLNNGGLILAFIAGYVLKEAIHGAYLASSGKHSCL